MRSMPLDFVRVGICVSLGVATAASLTAEASPRFTVTNDADKKVNVYIFAGDDSVCTWEEKLKNASAGETDSYGCTGGGKGQCKVQFYAEGSQICKKRGNTCSGNARKMKGKSTAVITSSWAFNDKTRKDEKVYVCDFSS